MLVQLSERVQYYDRDGKLVTEDLVGYTKRTHIMNKKQLINLQKIGKRLIKRQQLLKNSLIKVSS